MWRDSSKYNLELYDWHKCEGQYQMPIILKESVIPDDLIGFNYMKTAIHKNVGIHMYLDDYQFERLWKYPDKYLDDLKQFQCVLTPDFSLYMDMPIAMKIWNIYRSRLLGQYWQNKGIKVIPTISWAEEETYEFCFDGIERGSIVSVSTIGVKRSKKALEIWKSGMNAMIERINPSAICVYGGHIEFDYHHIPVTYYENKVIQRMRNLKVK